MELASSTAARSINAALAAQRSQILEQLVRGELDLLVPPLGSAVVAGDQAPSDAPAGSRRKRTRSAPSSRRRRPRSGPGAIPRSPRRSAPSGTRSARGRAAARPASATAARTGGRRSAASRAQPRPGSGRRKRSADSVALPMGHGPPRLRHRQTGSNTRSWPGRNQLRQALMRSVRRSSVSITTAEWAISVCPNCFGRTRGAPSPDGMAALAIWERHACSCRPLRHIRVEGLKVARPGPLREAADGPGRGSFLNPTRAGPALPRTPDGPRGWRNPLSALREHTNGSRSKLPTTPVPQLRLEPRRDLRRHAELLHHLIAGGLAHDELDACVSTARLGRR